MDLQDNMVAMALDTVTRSPQETRHLGRLLGELCHPGDVYGLVGDLGAGKTAFVQGLAQGLGVAADVPIVSPTFTLVNRYDGGRWPLHHVDLYRLETPSELEPIGLLELLGGDSVAAVEWADRFHVVLQAATVLIHLSVLDEQARKLVAHGQDDAGARRVADWLALGRVDRQQP
jgi:tRNA threonylcarbamoyladenosine biosynthesis protein TsaE